VSLGATLAASCPTPADRRLRQAFAAGKDYLIGGNNGAASVNQEDATNAPAKLKNKPAAISRGFDATTARTI